ncbi:conjugal transfer protein TraB [Novosphingobium sp. SL115]|uniref:TrbI/VirB10 family protein n=1 Tax=Novosphingobium sp. SL115 TaxID=2995150 RepID=UPI002274618B|nr:TrbI/VirB10 family protein [Novosphingobium sp. SL115]MCY1669618.1 conjugal transfer protein TraB [Novosphingobium sp. SL115]
MKLASLFRRKQRHALDPTPATGTPQGEVAPLGDANTINEAERRKQTLRLAGVGLFALVAGSLYIFSGDDPSGPSPDALASGVSVDDMVNTNMAEKEWRAQSEAQIASIETELRTLGARSERADQEQAQLGSGTGEAGDGSVSADTQRILSAYQAENDQLRAALNATKTTPVSPPAPALYGAGTSLYAQASPASAGSAAGEAAGIVAQRKSEVSLVSFGDAPPGTGSPVPKGNTVYTDSANYLPPNSIAVAKVIVGVDANAGVRSETDPLPVVLRITGPARSVYDRGRLLRTQISGCLVNGAARGDLSSEKVYVKLQRMTCPQKGGRYAVSDVKGFIAFGGKTGVRGRVVSREGALVGQAFLAGLAGGFGRGFSANSTALLTGSSVNVNGERQKLGTGDIFQGGIGEGVATSGDMVSKYLIERAEQYQPVIEMPTGIDVEIVFLEGVFIQG